MESGVVADVCQDGNHTFEVRAIDGAGNVQQPPYTAVAVVVDTVPPQVDVVRQPRYYISTTNATVCVALTDATATVADLTSMVDGESTALNGRCVAISGLTDGSHTVTIAVTDRAGNGASTDTSFVVDTVPPTHGVALRPVPTCVTATTSTGNMTVCSSADAAVFDVPCVNAASAVAVAPCSTWAHVDNVPISGVCSSQTVASVFNASALVVAGGGVVTPASVVRAALTQASQVSGCACSSPTSVSYLLYGVVWVQCIRPGKST